MNNLGELLKLTDKEIKELETNFNNKLEDDSFKKIVKNIDLPKETLISYTTQIEESANELKNCSKCKCLEECKNKVKGYRYYPFVQNESLSFGYEACNYQSSYEKDNEYKKNVELFEIPKKVKEASLKDLYKNDKKRIEFMKYVKQFIDEFKDNKNPKGIYLHGSYGTGKTYLIAALFNELAKKGIKSNIVYVPEFLRVLKTTFNKYDDDFDDYYETIKRSPLLLLDDIGAENLTPWARDEILGTILQYRMDEGLPTFFTSNYNLKELKEHFSITSNGIEVVKAGRMIERIKDLAVDFELVGESNR